MRSATATEPAPAPNSKTQVRAVITAYVDPDEYLQLRKILLDVGISVSEWVRRQIKHTLEDQQ